MTKFIKKISTPAPKWFIKIKKAATLLCDAAVIILLGIGYSQESLTILIMRVGVSAILQTVELFLTDQTNE